MERPLIPIDALRGGQESAMISALTLEQYHEICSWYLYKGSWIEISPHRVRLGSVISWLEDENQELAYLPGLIPREIGWRRFSAGRAEQEVLVMENGWTRFPLFCSEQTRITLTLEPHSNGLTHLRQWWLSQGNYIFREYLIGANYTEYSVVSRIDYLLTFPEHTSEALLEGHLFVCPSEELRSENGAFIARPECPAYWSLDPCGCERLSPEEASARGFPSFEWERELYLLTWDEPVYTGLRQFHAGKGFDPNTQDVARHFGCPLYELSCDRTPNGTRIEECSEQDAENPAMAAYATERLTEIHAEHPRVTPGQDTQMSAAHNVKFAIFGVILGLLLAYLYSL
ncbi:hypothetical protein B0H11DRAFT_1362570 [Mycena galericulata]|nr:hypothetical protein B0H11DRAFT_1362570 [Mycena galericulata]